MSLFSFIITFAVSWWLILFMLLPVGVKTIGSGEDGFASSAPKKPDIFKKMLWATILAAFFSYGFLFVIDAGYLDFLAIRPN